jgi:hypothetical protein
MSKKHVSTLINQSEVNKAGMAPPLVRDNRQFKPGTLGHWMNATNKKLTLISACNVKARRSATLGVIAGFL